jgi:hypothetical protein
MGNNFSDAFAAWLFASGALTADSKGTNTLTNHGTAGSGINIQGAPTVSLNGSSKYFDIVDANLDAGFPFKNGDTGKLITVAFKVRPASTAEQSTAGKMSFGTANSFGFTGSNKPFFQYNATFYDDWPFPAWVAAHEYQIVYTIDGVNKNIVIYLYDYTISVLHILNIHTFASALAGSTLPFRIGYDSSRGNYLNGEIGEVIVFNRLLNLAEMSAIRKDIYNGPISIPTTAECLGSPVGATISVGGDFTGDIAPEYDIVPISTDLASLRIVGNSYPQNVYAQATVNGPGVLSFYWTMVGANTTFEALVDGVQQDILGPLSSPYAVLTWAQKSYTIVGAGDHIVKWNWYHYQSGYSVDNAGFVARVVWTPASYPPANCLSLTFCESIPAAPAPCLSLTTCEDIPIVYPPDNCLSPTQCPGIEPPRLGICLSLTHCPELPKGAPASVIISTKCQDIPLASGRGTFLIFS